MRTKIIAVIMLFCGMFLATNARAQECPFDTSWEGYCISESGDYLYTEENNTITINRYIGQSDNATIPAEINSLPVTSLGLYTHQFLRGMSLGAFESLEITLTSVTIPDGITDIGASTFWGCTSLSNVTIPDSVTSIWNYAFDQCSALTIAYFLGNAPSTGSNVFRGTAPDFSICYTSGAAGFTTPTWEDYPAAPCCSDDSDCADNEICLDGICEEVNQSPEFLTGPLWVGPWVGLSTDPAAPHIPQSQHVVFWAYDDDGVGCQTAPDLNWMYRPVELQEGGGVLPRGDWVVKTPQKFLWFVWIADPYIADIPGSGLFEFKMTATDCLGQTIDSETVFGKRYYIEVD